MVMGRIHLESLSGEERSQWEGRAGAVVGEHLIPRPSWSSSASCTQSGRLCESMSGSLSCISCVDSIIVFWAIESPAYRISSGNEPAAPGTRVLRHV